MEWPRFDLAGAIKCHHCAEGYRHPVGNCVLCGWGPAPGAEDRPETPEARARALAELAVAIARDRLEHPWMFDVKD